jgi:spermidine synthase
VAALLPALVLLFLVSGACGLIYQVLWLRLLGLVFGVTVYSASTVWASFMAGLALGSYLGGKVGDRTRVPLIWFGVVEILVGVSALATPAGLAALQHLYGSALPSLPESFAALTAARAVMSFLVLLVPTLMMGASLPLIIRSSMFRGGTLGSRVGLLYGTNTSGAILGTLAAGLYLIPTIGIARTFQTAALMNVSAGLIAVLLGLALRRKPAADHGATTAAAAAASADGRVDLPVTARRLVLWVFIVSGFATLALEVVWFRAIVLVARPTVYTFAIMLATVLFGIAVGSFLITPFMRRRWNWIGLLAAAEIAMGFAALVSFAALGRVSDVNAAIAPHLEPLVPSFLTYAIAAALPVVLPSCLLMGIAYPIGLHLYVGATAGDSTRAASRIGSFNSLNLVGAIVGSLIGGFVLLPLLGSRTSLMLIAIVIFTSGLALLMYVVKKPALRLGGVAVLAAGFAVLAVRTVDPFQVFLKIRYPGQTVAWYEEAVEGTVSVHGDRPGSYMLVLDGNHQANDTGPMLATHRRIALLGLALHPEARDVLVVGLGGGATPGAAVTHEGVDVDVVELSSAVVRASKFFAHANHNLLEQPNVHMRVDDGRNYLTLTKKKYDLITADLIQPIHAGSNNVYSKEYFEAVRAALKPGGMTMQWANGTEAEYKTICRTFQTVFPYATVWGDGSLLLGTLEPLVLRESDYTWKLQSPGRHQGLVELGADTFDKLLAMYMAGPDELRAYLGDGPILTDDRPLAEYFLSLPRGRNPDRSGLHGDVRRHVR